MMKRPSRMRDVREKMELRQIDLAIKSGVSVAWIRYAENANGIGVSGEVKTKIARILRVPEGEIFQT